MLFPGSSVYYFFPVSDEGTTGFSFSRRALALRPYLPNVKGLGFRVGGITAPTNAKLILGSLARPTAAWK